MEMCEKKQKNFLLLSTIVMCTFFCISSLQSSQTIDEWKASQRGWFGVKTLALQAFEMLEELTPTSGIEKTKKEIVSQEYTGQRLSDLVIYLRDETRNRRLAEYKIRNSLIPILSALHQTKPVTQLSELLKKVLQSKGKSLEELQPIQLEDDASPWIKKIQSNIYEVYKNFRLNEYAQTEKYIDDTTELLKEKDDIMQFGDKKFLWSKLKSYSLEDIIKNKRIPITKELTNALKTYKSAINTKGFMQKNDTYTDATQAINTINKLVFPRKTQQIIQTKKELLESEGKKTAEKIEVLKKEELPDQLGQFEQVSPEKQELQQKLKTIYEKEDREKKKLEDITPFIKKQDEQIKKEVTAKKNIELLSDTIIKSEQMLQKLKTDKNLTSFVQNTETIAVNLVKLQRDRDLGGYTIDDAIVYYATNISTNYLQAIDAYIEAIENLKSILQTRPELMQEGQTAKKDIEFYQEKLTILAEHLSKKYIVAFNQENERNMLALKNQITEVLTTTRTLKRQYPPLDAEMGFLEKKSADIAAAVTDATRAALAPSIDRAAEKIKEVQRTIEQTRTYFDSFRHALASAITVLKSPFTRLQENLRNSAATFVKYWRKVQSEDKK